MSSGPRAPKALKAPRAPRAPRAPSSGAVWLVLLASLLLHAMPQPVMAIGRGAIVSTVLSVLERVGLTSGGVVSANTLAATLVAGSTTGGTDLTIAAADSLFFGADVAITRTAVNEIEATDGAGGTAAMVWNGTILFPDDSQWAMGSLGDTSMQFSTNQDNPGLVLGVDDTNRYLLLCEQSDAFDNFTFPLQDQPTLVVWGVDSSVLQERASIAVSSSAALFGSGSGVFRFFDGDQDTTVATIDAAGVDMGLGSVLFGGSFASADIGIARVGSGVVAFTQPALVDSDPERAAFQARVHYEAHTSGDTIDTVETGSLHSNAGAGGAITIVLPSAAVDGTTYAFVSVGGNQLRVDPASGDNFAYSGGAMTNGEYLGVTDGSLSVVYDLSETLWLVHSESGTLAEETP